MKKFYRRLFSLSAFAVSGLIFCAAIAPEKPENFDPPKQLKIAIVDFKTCVEKSKLGKQEQANFDALKKQMETILEEKEIALNDLAGKFNDMDYLDSLSPDAEAELRRKFRALNQELTQQQSQYYQALNQANIKIIQKITDVIAEASKEIARKHKIDLVLNEDGAFYKIADLDISNLVITSMDEKYDKETKEMKEAQPGAGMALLD
jgi:outer membrane protein